MSAMAKVLKYQLQDLLRSRWILGYALLFLLLTGGLFRFGGDTQRVVLSLMNAILLLIPLVSLLFGTIYLYHAREFTELLLAQPVSRSSLFAGLYGGLAGPLAVAFVIGVGIPCIMYGSADRASTLPLIFLLGTGVLLTLVFTAIACLVALRFDDRAKGLGVALLIWLLATVLYDGLVLLVAIGFSDYPLEMPMLTLTFLNPVDLGRVLMVLQFDIAALMGYTGAVFQRFFGGTCGIPLAAAALAAWILIPLWLGRWMFRRKDF
jgi:Cu-processing system permease protein